MSSSFWAGGTGSADRGAGFAQPGQGGQHSKRTGAGRSSNSGSNFWLGGDEGGEAAAGGGGASLSGDEDQLEEPDAGFGLQLGREYNDSNSNTPSAGVHVGASSPSTMLGLTSMDFWSMDPGNAANPSSGIAGARAGAAGRTSPSRAAAMDTRDFIKQEEMDDTGDNEFNSLFSTLADPLVRARREMAFSRGGGAGGGFQASSPEGMDFDDLVNTESFGPSSLFYNGSAATRDTGLAGLATDNYSREGTTSSFAEYINSGATSSRDVPLSEITIPGAFDPDAMFGSAPSSAFNSPISSAPGGMALQELLGHVMREPVSASQQPGQLAPVLSQGTTQQQQQRQGPSSSFATTRNSQSGIAHQRSGSNGIHTANSRFNTFSPESSPASPNSILQQFASSGSASDPNSGSSRSSSANPASRPVTAEAGKNVPSIEQGLRPVTASAFQAPRSHVPSGKQPAASNGVTQAAAPVPSAISRSQSAADLKKSKSSVSVASSTATETRNSSTTSTTPREVAPAVKKEDPAERQYGEGTSLSDKLQQAQPADSSAFVKTVVRDPSLVHDKYSQCQLVVLGLPDEGARSRVETQVKISLVLVRPKKTAPGKSAPAPTAAAQGKTPHAMNFKDAKGAFTPEVDEHFEKVGNWKYISLPTVSSVKRKAKKHYRTGLPVEQTLFADIKVVSATSPSKEIYICSNCQAREVKRIQRKTQNRSKPSQDIGSGGEDEKGMTEDELARRKIVLFNCGKYLDFENGEVVIPTRITCYCRHHKEKYGFHIVYTLTDHLDNVVAVAASPAVFLTDDHKARPTKPDAIDLKHIPSLASVANGPRSAHSRNSSAATSVPGSMPSSAASSLPSSQIPSAASSAGPSRDNSFENLQDLHQQAGGGAAAQPIRGKRDRSNKPYSMDARPAKPKRTNSLNRLNNFAMTPLTLSAPASPRLGTRSPLTAMTSLPQDYFQSQVQEPLQDFANMLNTSSSGSAGIDIQPSPGSSLSAPSTPGAGLEGLSTSFGSYASGSHLAFMPGSISSTSDDLASNSSRSVEPSPAFPGFMPLPHQTQLQSRPSQAAGTTQQLRTQQQQGLSFGLPVQSPNLAQHLASLEMAENEALRLPIPSISRLIPAEGPVHGGIEVIILGENFSQGLEITFGDIPAISTQAWGVNTLMCVLPPSPSPGPVVVGIKNLQANHNTGIQLFTYLDTSDKALMELALQVVGMKMTGRIDDARSVARRIIAGNAAGDSGSTGNSPPSSAGGYAQHAGGVRMSKSSLALHDQLLTMGERGETRDFQAIIMKLLSLLDVPDDSSGAEDEQDVNALTENPINYRNEQSLTLLHLATVLGFHRLAAFLVERDADLDVCDKHGYTALHHAALRGRVAVTRVLLEAGAAIFIRNNAGQTALNIARERDQVDVETLYPRRLRSHTPSSTSRLPSGRASPTPLQLSPGLSGRASPMELRDTGMRQRKKLFSLSHRTSRTDSDHADDDSGTSDWSSEEGEDAASAPGSDLESRLSRHASNVSLARSYAQSPPPELADSDDDDLPEVRPAGIIGVPTYEGSDSPTTATVHNASWLARQLLARMPHLRLPAPPTLASWRLSSSPSSLSVASTRASTISTASTTASTAPSTHASDVDEPECFPRRSLFIQEPAKPPSLRPSASSLQQQNVGRLKASLKKRLGYSVDNLTEDALRSYSYHAQKYNTLRKDNMLYFFWLPLLFAPLVWAALQASSAAQSALLGFQRIAPLDATMGELRS